MKVTKEDVTEILDINNFVEQCSYFSPSVPSNMCNSGSITEKKVVGKTKTGKNRYDFVQVQCPRCKGTGVVLNRNGEEFLELTTKLNAVKEHLKISLPLKTGYDGY